MEGAGGLREVVGDELWLVAVENFNENFVEKYPRKGPQCPNGTCPPSRVPKRGGRSLCKPLYTA